MTYLVLGVVVVRASVGGDAPVVAVAVVAGARVVQVGRTTEVSVWFL